MNRWALIAETFEQTDADEWQPVVRHEFYGADAGEAVAILRAHLQADAFLRDCTTTGRYGDVVCRTELRMRDPAGVERPFLGKIG